MCLSCGCGSPDDSHGDDRHITRADILAAADAAGIKPGKAAKNVRRGMRDALDAEKMASPAERLRVAAEEYGPPTNYVKRMDPRPVP